jgi:hypothetical protein
MAKRVGLKGLSDALDKILTQYGEEVEGKMSEIVPKVAARGAKALREESGKTFGSPSGKQKYAKGWRSKTGKGRLRTTATIYNAKAPGLSHLLEHGHANRDGGRTPGRAHISPVEEKIINEFEEEVKRRL